MLYLYGYCVGLTVAAFAGTPLPIALAFDAGFVVVAVLYLGISKYRGWR